MIEPDNSGAPNSIHSISVFIRFISAVNRGEAPPTDVLAAIAEGLTLYITNPLPVIDDHRSDQKLKSLDECFGLKPKQGVGHPVKHTVNKCVRAFHLKAMCELREASMAEGRRISIEDAAGIVINSHNLNINEDILVKEYRAYGGDPAIKAWPTG